MLEFEKGDEGMMNKADNSEKWMVWVLWFWAMSQIAKAHDWWGFWMVIGLTVLILINKVLDLILQSLDSALSKLHEN